MNTKSDFKGASCKCEIVIPIVLKIPIYFEPIVVEVSPTCSLSPDEVNASESTSTVVESTHDRVQKTSEFLSAKVEIIDLPKTQVLIKQQMPFIRTEFAFKLRALTKAIKFYYSRSLKMMIRFLHQVRRRSRQLGSRSTRRDSYSRRVFH